MSESMQGLNRSSRAIQLQLEVELGTRTDCFAARVVLLL